MPSTLPRPRHQLTVLLDREARLRDAARHLELDPGLQAEAARLFDRADQVRSERQALAERCER